MTPDERPLDLFDASPPDPPQETSSSPAEAAAPATPRSKRRGPRIWTVTEVNRAIRTLLEESVPAVWIGGEVAGWTRARSGHCYFTLKDEQAQIKSVLFRTDAGRLSGDPEEGMRVRVYGTLTVYEARGDYQFVARRIELDEGEGSWRRRFEEVRRKLEAEGLTAEQRKRPLPALPRTIGVVTSTQGAALRDIVAGLETRAPWVRVLVRGARVQGEGSAREIARAIDALAATGLPDLLIVGRGGGSIEDLWAFNEEEVARAIARCPIPVISAVGHEVDVTIADLVADVRAPTPSGAAAVAVQVAASRLASLREMRPRLARALRVRVDRMRVRTTGASDRLTRATTRLIERQRARARGLGGRLDALSPLKTLERGYAVPVNDEGRVLRTVTDFTPDQPFRLRVRDGEVRANTIGSRPSRLDEDL